MPSLSWPGASSPEVVDLPRQGAVSSSQALLGALLAEYSFEEASPLTSDDVVVLLSDFGVSESAARSALSRTVKRGLLRVRRNGSRSSYELSGQARLTHESKLRSVVTFGSDAVAWDGAWTMAIFTIPESHRAVRQRFRHGLQAIGFAPMADAVWVCPWRRGGEAGQLAGEHNVELACVRGPAESFGRGMLDPLKAFPLGELRREFDAFLGEYRSVANQAAAGLTDPSSALTLRTGVLREWRRIAAMDPQLPLELLPPDWPRPDAYTVFRTIWERLAPVALERVKDLLREGNPELSQELQQWAGASMLESPHVGANEP
jgi:phenylacetic acid degradation operon negative regulatory protein